MNIDDIKRDTADLLGITDLTQLDYITPELIALSCCLSLCLLG